MKLRKRYVFDSWRPGTFKFLEVLAVSSDERTFYLEGGTNGGVRYLAHFDARGNLYLSRRLHADILVRANPDEEEEVRKQLAHHMPVEPARLLDMEEVPGFSRDADGTIRHKHGWFTRGERALELATPRWMESNGSGAKIFDIREGIYIYFQDGSIRLSGRKEWYQFHDAMRSAAHIWCRQGDCFLVTMWLGSDIWFEAVSLDPTKSLTATLGRHSVDLTPLEMKNNWSLTHPEHEKAEGPGNPNWMVLLPGSSRPFSRHGDGD